MALDATVKEQVKPYLDLLESDLVFQASLGEDGHSQKVSDFLTEITAMSDRLSLEMKKLERTPSFAIAKKGEDSGIVFAGLPLGHELASFILALVQVSGRPPKIDPALVDKIKSIQTPMQFETYVSLTCHNCPDIVQAFNIMSVLNSKISHTMIEGGMYQDEIETKGIMAVPTTFKDGEEFSAGRSSLEALLDKVLSFEEKVEVDFSDKGVFDTLIVGGGPAGNSAAIYAARKGIKTGLLAKDFGGQVMETVGIENVIGTPYIEGPQLMANVEKHTQQYPVDIIKGQEVVDLAKDDKEITLTLENGGHLKAKTVILALGAKWRSVNVPGEKEFQNKGVTYCPHCDGPLFEGKRVAVIGGGNSGLEAAIDLAGLASHVDIIEFLPELKADHILQESAKSLDNITIIKNAQTSEITGQEKVTGLNYLDRSSNEQHHLDVDGVFVQIGLVPSTSWLEKTAISRNQKGEIIVDKDGSTSMEGVFAAGDCTDSAYKQIIISMGSGASAALGAFDYLIRQG